MAYLEDLLAIARTCETQAELERRVHGNIGIQILQAAAADAVVAALEGPLPIAIPFNSLITQFPYLSAWLTDDESTPSNASSVSIQFSSDFSGQVDGVDVDALLTSVLSWEARPGAVLEAMEVNHESGSFQISAVIDEN